MHFHPGGLLCLFSYFLDPPCFIAMAQTIPTLSQPSSDELKRLQDDEELNHQRESYDPTKIIYGEDDPVAGGVMPDTAISVAPNPLSGILTASPINDENSTDGAKEGDETSVIGSVLDAPGHLSPSPLMQEDKNTLPESTVFSSIPQSSGAPTWVQEMFPDPEAQKRYLEMEILINDIHEAAVDDEGYFRKNKIDVSFANDPKAARHAIITERYMIARNGGQPLPTDSLLRKQLQVSIAIHDFEGIGMNSTEEFYGQIRKQAHEANGRKKIIDLTSQSASKEVIHRINQRYQAGERLLDAHSILAQDQVTGGFNDLLKDLREIDGFKDDDIIFYHRAYDKAVEQQAGYFTPLADAIGETFSAMKKGNAGTVSSFLTKLQKSPAGGLAQYYFRKPGEEVTLGDAIKDVVDHDAAATAGRLLYDGDLKKDQRKTYLEAIRILANELPKEQQVDFWNNLGKQTSRDIDDQGRNMKDSLVDHVLSNTDRVTNAGSYLIDHTASLLGFDDDASQGKDHNVSKKSDLAGKYRAARDLASDVRNIERTVYDPMKSAWGDQEIGALESGLYGVPGALATTAVAAIPYAGLALTYFSMEGAAYDDLRRQMIQVGVDPEQASILSSRWAPVAAAPQLLLEKLQLSKIGKLPASEKLLGGFMNSVDGSLARRLAGTAARTSIRVAGNTLEQTMTEIGQNLMPGLTHQLAAALEKDLPGAPWTTPDKKGIFDGFASQSLSTLVTMVPLALMGIPSHIRADRRVLTFHRATNTQLVAMGMSQADIGTIREATSRGNFSAIRAIEDAMQRLEPRSEAARAATMELEKQKSMREAATARLQALGAYPTITHHAEDGTLTVSDAQGRELMKTKDAEKAIRYAGERIDAAHASRDEQTALLARTVMATNVRGALLAAEQLPGSNSHTRIEPGAEVDSHNFTDYFKEDRRNPTQESARRLTEQVQMEILAEGGDPNAVHAIWGASSLEMQQDVRKTLNRIFDGGSVLTVFHEKSHEMRRNAYHFSAMDRGRELAMYRAYDVAVGSATSRDAEGKRRSLRLLPEGVADAHVTEQMLDEAFSHLMEAEVLRSRWDQSSKLRVPSALVSENLTAVAKQLDPDAARSWRSLLKAVRHYWGVTFSRAHAFHRALEHGKLDRSQHDAFLSSMIGLDGSHEAVKDGETRSDGSAVFDKDGNIRISHSFSISPEKAIQIRNEIDAQRPIEVTTIGIPSNMRAKEAIQWAIDHHAGGETSHPEIGKIEIRNRGIKNAMGHMLVPKKMAALLNLRKIIPQSTMMSFLKRTEGPDSYRLAGKINIDGVDYVARIVIHTDSNGVRYYNHELSDFKELHQNKDPQPLIPGVDSKNQQIGVEEIEDTGKLLQWIYSVNETTAQTETSAKAQTTTEGKSETSFSLGPAPALIQPLDPSTQSHQNEHHERLREPIQILEALGVETDDYRRGPQGIRTDDGKRRKHGKKLSGDSGILAWAQRHGRILDPKPFGEFRGEDSPGGGEHKVIIDRDSHRVIKLTKPGLFGAQAEDAIAYLERWALHNRAFRDDVAFEGLVTLPGEHAPRAVISQRYAEGRDATAEEQADFLKGKGFYEQPDGRWIHPIRGITVWDTITPGNVIATADGLRVIDLQVSPTPSQELASVRQQTGIGRQTSFSIGHSPPNPKHNPYRDADGKLPTTPYHRSAQDPDLAEKEATFNKILTAPPEEADAAYNAVPETHGGKVLGTDLAREVLPEYNTPEGRARYTGITTTTASQYSKDRLWREIHHRGDREGLLFTAGGPASGKSTVVNDKLIKSNDLIYDGTLRDTDWAIKNLEAASTNGWKSAVVSVQRPIRLAAISTIQRALIEGRAFALSDLPLAHYSAQKSAIKIAKHFSNDPHVDVRFYLNNGITRETPPIHITLEQVDSGGKYSYDNYNESGKRKSMEGALGEHPRSDYELFRASTREDIVGVFRDAVEGRITVDGKRPSHELLLQLAGKDPELQQILKDHKE